LILSLWPALTVLQVDVPHLSMHSGRMRPWEGTWVKIAPVSSNQMLYEIMPECPTDRRGNEWLASFVIPAQAGIQIEPNKQERLDARLRGHDG